ncbi:hypothetical protein J2753_002459 [Halolamina salifodinae]|uniref:Uncharacterized protein n=1 Tax=Halolamina salifodinae TaxID=1202767 RepID=A0A8T4GY58_9EURY|nr:hypothetical protein [Halolamina salifodinae]
MCSVCTPVTVAQASVVGWFESIPATASVADFHYRERRLSVADFHYRERRLSVADFHYRERRLSVADFHYRQSYTATARSSSTERPFGLRA